MGTRPLGQTNRVVSPLGLGLAALGRPGYINLGHADDLDREYAVAAMEDRAHGVLDAAWQAGVRYFDVARSYGNAEAFLSTWLSSRNIPPDGITVGSKWGYTYTAGWKVEAERHEVKDHSLAVLMRQVGESTRLLGPYLGLYQIHSATLESGVLDHRDVLEELARLRSTGLRIGLTLTGPRQAQTLEKALGIRTGGERVFDCVQATWNLLERSAGPMLQAAHKAGLGVIIKEALANGRLTPRNTDPAFAPQRRLLEENAARLQTTVDALALAAALAQPWVDVVLSGASSVQQLHSNLGAMAVRFDDEVGERLRCLEEDPEVYWATRSRLPWN
jgi:aryl-alcohol dehydrogenase-like predicted oxidoreductase